MFPTLSEAIAGERLTVGPPFFNKWMLPIGLVLLLLTGVGPLLAWRKSTLGNLRDQFLWPVLSATIVGGAFVALGFRVWVSGICVALCAFVTATIAQEFWRGARVRQGNTGTDLLTALIGLTSRNKRRYGGYIVHLGIVLIFFGFAGEGFKQEKQVLMKPGEETTLGQYTIRYDRLSVADDGQKQMVTGHTTIFEGGRQIDAMFPAKWAFHKHETEPPTTEVAIRRALSEDLYIVLAAYDAGSQAATFQIFVNPLVNWIWLGFGIMAFGTGIALLPERSFSFALSKLPGRDAVTTTAALLLAVFLGTATLSAQHDPNSIADQMAPANPRNQIEASLYRRMVCLCGSCGKEPIGTCTCSVAAGVRKEIAALVDEGKSEDEIVQHFIAKYGSQELLGAPLDQGIGRFAWLFPYLVGASGAVVIGFAAVRWSRRQDTAPAEAGQAGDPALDERLDDELRNLD
jgi:cytochrome c-type biogenesis protein CcmF